VDGDTVFAHARTVRDSAGRISTFRDTLKDGNAYGPTYVGPLKDTKNPLTHYGYAAWDNGWTKKTLGSAGIGRYYQVDVMVPHTSAFADLTVRYVPTSSCTPTEPEEWAVGKDDIVVKTYSTPTAPFRPWVKMATKGSAGTVIGKTHTWLRFDTSSTIKSSDVLSYSFRIVKWPQVKRGWAVELSNLDHNTVTSAPYDMTNSNCQSTSKCNTLEGCDSCRTNRFSLAGCPIGDVNCLMFYRICYSWKDLPDWPCDETQRPSRGVWHDENVDIYEKFMTRYRKEDVPAAMNLRIQFVFTSSSPYGMDQDIEIHFDDIKVGGATSYEEAGAKGCGEIELKSNTETTSSTKGMEIKITDSTGTKKTGRRC
jgi:hypothetical protein